MGKTNLKTRKRLEDSLSEKEDKVPLQELQSSSPHATPQPPQPSIQESSSPQNSHKWRNTAIIGNSFFCLLMAMAAYSFFLSFFADEVPKLKT